MNYFLIRNGYTPFYFKNFGEAYQRLRSDSRKLRQALFERIVKVGDAAAAPAASAGKQLAEREPEKARPHANLGAPIPAVAGASELRHLSSAPSRRSPEVERAIHALSIEKAFDASAARELDRSLGNVFALLPQANEAAASELRKFIAESARREGEPSLRVSAAANETIVLGLTPSVAGDLPLLELLDNHVNGQVPIVAFVGTDAEAGKINSEVFDLDHPALATTIMHAAHIRSELRLRGHVRLIALGPEKDRAFVAQLTRQVADGGIEVIDRTGALSQLEEILGLNRLASELRAELKERWALWIAS
jgi:hypothetical protein